MLRARGSNLRSYIKRRFRGSGSSRMVWLLGFRFRLYGVQCSGLGFRISRV